MTHTPLIFKKLSALLPVFFALVLYSSFSVAQAPDPRKGVFSAEFPFQSKFIEVNGHNLHYIDEGNSDGDTFLFLHGNPTSSYLWRNIMPYVKAGNRIVAVDNIGFGKSDQPTDLDYTFQTHYQYIEEFIEKTDLENIILVIHDWGSVLGLNYAMENSSNVKGIVMMEALIPPAFPTDNAGFFSSFRNPETGKELLIEQNMFIEGILLTGAVTRSLSDAEKDVYRAPFLSADTRFPIYVWPNELPIAGEPARNVVVIENIGKWLQESPIPKLVQYADPGVMINAERAQWMVDNYRNVEIQFVGYGTHYIQEDNPQIIGRGIVEWHRRTF
ncbi:MAG: haloalkane dehalogenase [SAR86 cluster bacterium]|uniref:Haloalkane dehalogenase n=1 Tax=SAR86 cluster bacterium TaxID=2030880 RepID=A0A2A5B245_9GAMM|nr:MAG: haloalkane dehalogenase [SAR86 cluster bacterium]